LKLTKFNLTSKQIESLLDTFDFCKVHKAMAAVNWEWDSCGLVPTEEEIRQQARRLLKNISPPITSSSTGGLQAYTEESDSGKVVGIRFVMCDRTTEWI